jgi:Ca2+-binding RTX toxin-like protein
VSIDTLNPTVSVNVVDASLNDGDPASQVTFEFSENVTGFDATDVSTGNGSLSGFSAIDGNSYTATFTATDNVAGTGTVTVGTGFVDGSGNTGIGGSDSVSIDRRDPVITASLTATPGGPLTSGETINYTADIANSGATSATGVVFSDPLDSNTTLVNGSVKVTPIAFDDEYEALIGSTLTISDAASGLLGNDIDPTVGGGAARLDLTAQPIRDSANSTAPGGALSVNLSDGTFTYSPSVSAASGQIEVFTYNIVDAESLNAVETGVITFTTVYGVAVDDTYESLGNVGIEVDAAHGVLANDTNATSVVATDFFGGQSAQNGSFVMYSDGSFSYDPAPGFAGVDTFVYTISDSGGDIGTVSVSIDEVIWFIDNSFGGGGDGSLANPFDELMDVSGGADPDAPGDHIFVYATGTDYSTLSLENDQSLVGEGAVGPDLATVLGITLPEFSQTLPALNGASPVFSIPSNNTVIELASGNLIDGIAIETGGASGLMGIAVGNSIIRNVEIDVTNLASDGAGIGITSTSGELTFSNVEITTSGGTTAGTGIEIDGGDATIQFNNVDITQTGGRLVSINGAGDVTFDAESDLTLTSGSVSGGGIKLSGSATSTFNLEGDIQLSGAGSAGAFVATGGGIVNVTGSNNTIVSTSPAAAGLTISGGTIIGNSGVTFKSIQSSGSTATVLTGTGAINGLTITGGSFTSDAYVGSDGPDVLRGGPGADTLTGGPGADRFDLAAGEGNPLLVQEETITDFKDGVDRIGLLGGLTFADLTIGSFSGHATIQVTATGEFLATVLDEAGNIDASDFAQPLLVDNAGRRSSSSTNTNRSVNVPQGSPAAGDQAGSLLVDDGVLSQSELDFIVDAATARWISTGLSNAQTQALAGTTYEVSELPDWYLGVFDGAGVTIDSDAAGYNWYLDATPFDDGDDVIGSRVDLLTTVMHEMGHVLGLGDIYDSTKSDSLMYGFLSPGERRTPVIGQADGATPGSVLSEAFMISPITIGTLPVGKAVQITFAATVNSGLSPSVTQVSNQGTVSGQNFVNVLTDDPTVGGAANSTITAIDNAPPTVTVNIVDASLSDSDAVSAITFEFSENVVGFTSADVSVSGGSLSNFNTVDGNSYTATFTANGGIDATGSVSVGTGYTDATGNTGAAGSDNVAIDTLNPTVTVNIIDSSLSDSDAASSVTFEFSEDVVGFTSADVSVSGGTLSNFSTVDGNSYTATFTANGGVDLAGSVSIGASSYTDAAGNNGSGGSDTVTIDTLNPTVTVNIVDSSLSDSDAASAVSFEFSENVVGFTSADVSVSGGTLSNFSTVDGNSYTATFTANGGIDATGSVSVGTGYTDAVGNTGATGSDNVAIDTQNPTVTVNIVDSSLSDSDTASVITFEFSENVVGFTSADLSASGGTLSNFNTVDGNSYTATFTANGGIDATGSVSVGTGYTDAAGNTGAAGSDNVVIDTLDPTVTVNIIDGSLSIDDAQSSVTFEFSENISGFNAEDVSVSGGTLSGFSTVDGNSYNATFTANGSVDTTGSVSVGTGYTDAVGNRGSAGSDNVAIDTLSPTVTVNIVDASLSDSDTESLVTFEFSENILGFGLEDVALSGGMLSGFAAVDGDSYSAIFTANNGVELMGSVSVGTGYTDVVGNAGADASSTVTIDTLNPTVTVTPNGTVTSDDLIVFTFQFNEPVSGFTSGDVAVTNGVLQSFTPVDPDTYTIEVTPSPGAVIVAIADGVAQDSAGNSSEAGNSSVISPGLGEVALPGEGTYELLISNADLVMRFVAGVELFRRPTLSVTELRIMGSTGADLVTVLDSGGAISTPIRFSGNDGADRFNATLATGPTTIQGGSGNDTLLGGTGTDIVQITGASVVATDGSASGEGDDTFSSIEGMILVANGSGSTIDASTFSAGPVTIIGSGGADTLAGGTGNDLILAGGGGDSISGGAGNDLMSGGAGPDIISGDNGDDTIIGGRGRDSLSGGSDGDEISGGGGPDTIGGNAGDDRIRGNGGRDDIDGGDGADTLLGSSGRDLLVGGLGADSLNGVAVDDSFNQVVGRDTLIGGLRPSGRPAPVTKPVTPSDEPLLPTFTIPNNIGVSGKTALDSLQDNTDEAFAGTLLPRLLEL